MKSLPRILLVVLLPGVLHAEVDFVHEIVPVLKQHCAECHGGEESEGGFSINTRKLFLDDDSAVPGDPGESYFLQLIEDTDPDYQMPPEDKDRVPAEQLALLKRWVAEGMKWEPGFTFGAPVYEPPLRPRTPDLPPARNGRDHPVDRIVDEYLSRQELPRPESIPDLVFLRRAHLDLVGLLPTPEEIREFEADSSPEKRTRKIEELLDRDIPYTEHWLTFWNDLLRNDYTGTGFITKGRTQISTWLYDSLKENKPFDTMVRELIAPPGEDSAGFINGIKWRGTVSAGQTLPIQFSQSISQSFLGINMKCASCHDSFIDRWTLEEAYGLAAIYSEEPIEIHRCDKPVGTTATASWLFPEIGNVDPKAPKEKRLSQLAALMTHPENGRVPRTIVNRLWGQLMGRGIVHPLDAMQTEPWDADLLDFLASDFAEHGYDLKRTLFLIATSEAYQGRVEIVESPDDSDDFRFSGPRSRRLTAEQFVDAIWQITGTAPDNISAQVVRAVPLAGEEALPPRTSRWIWGPSAAPGPPPGGEKILLRKDFTVSKPVRAAGVIATADNAFTLHVNNQQALAGSQWTQLKSAPVAPRLRQGANRLLFVVENGLDKPNAAGAYLALRIEYEDGSEEIVETDESWTASSKVPEGAQVAKWPIDKLEWQPVVPVALSVWHEAINPQIPSALSLASSRSSHMPRSSLMASDFLMRSLGRPNRDQIVTSRPSELTTLEAIDLANSDQLAGYLAQGAEMLRQREWASPEALVEELYLSTLTRRPTPEESALLGSALGDQPAAAQIADALWALTLTPEFLLVR